MAMTPLEGNRRPSIAGKIAGMKLKDLAKYIKSWNICEAAIGLAAINSYYNNKDKVNSLDSNEFVVESTNNSFEFFSEYIKGKKVGIIGHFPIVDELSKYCDLSVLERLPQKGDLPDMACEYILPTKETVIITATALENKTMPRILELSRNAYTIILGPSTPLNIELLNYGANALAGNIVNYSKDVKRISSEGGMSMDLKPYMSNIIIQKV